MKKNYFNQDEILPTIQPKQMKLEKEIEMQIFTINSSRDSLTTVNIMELLIDYYIKHLQWATKPLIVLRPNQQKMNLPFKSVALATLHKTSLFYSHNSSGFEDLQMFPYLQVSRYLMVEDYQMATAGHWDKDLCKMCDRKLTVTLPAPCENNRWNVQV